MSEYTRLCIGDLLVHASDPFDYCYLIVGVSVDRIWYMAPGGSMGNAISIFRGPWTRAGWHIL